MSGLVLCDHGHVKLSPHAKMRDTAGVCGPTAPVSVTDDACRDLSITEGLGYKRPHRELPLAKHITGGQQLKMSDGSDGMQNPDELAPSDPGRRKPRTARTPAERLSAVQEKNRRAQKRFRERQKVRPSARRCSDTC